jgi:hypothetical protein
MDAMPFELASLTSRRYLCSACWGKLLPPAPAEGGGFVVLCETCGDETKGYVSQFYVDHRRGESVGEEREVKQMLVKMGILPDPLAGKSKETLLKELGYGKDC